MADQGEGFFDDEQPKPDLKFSGGRFEGVGFPLDRIHELTKYQRLLVEVARQIWAEQNPGKSLPDNFDDKVRLRLIDLQPGSQKTYFAPEEGLKFPGVPSIRDMAEDTIYSLFSQIVANNFGQIAAATPGVVTAFKAIGNGFSDEEMVAIRPESPQEVRYGIVEHRALVRALRGVRTDRTGTLIGIIDNLERANKFSLVDGVGQSIGAKFSDNEVWAALHTLHNQKDKADLIWIECDYEVSEVDGTVVKITEVRDANLFAKSTNKWAVRLAKFAALPEGHADGEGERTEVHAVEAALSVLDSITESGWQEPAIFPSLDGGVRMEWLSDNEHTVLTVDNDANFYAFHLNDETDEEAIEEPVGVKNALAFLERFVQ